MKLVPIFVGGDMEKQGGLLAVQYNEGPNEFERLFDLWHDTEHLGTFFYEHIHDLQDHGLGKDTDEVIKDAVIEIMDEANELEDVMTELVHAGFENAGRDLQHIFKPLDNRVYELKPLQKSKASVKTRMRPEPKLRIYAIRLASNLYIITGGAIKLTHRMEERPHTAAELTKIERVRQWLKDNEIIEPEDVNDQF